MTSLFISSSNRVENNLYRIGSKITYSGVKLKSASILNNYFNCVSFQVTLTINSVNIPVTISDGNYTPQQMATYLENKLNQYGNGTQWKVYFNQAALKFSIQYTSLSSNPVSLTFNNNSLTFFGITNSPIVFGPNVVTYFEFPSQTISQPGFYRVECRDLSTTSMYFEDNPNSGILGIVPINTLYGQNQTYNDSDNFFIQSDVKNDLYNFLSIRIFLGDSDVELQNPQFGLTLHFI